MAGDLLPDGLPWAVVCYDGHVTDPRVSFLFEEEAEFDYTKYCRRRGPYQYGPHRCRLPARQLTGAEETAFRLGGEPAVCELLRELQRWTHG